MKILSIFISLFFLNQIISEEFESIGQVALKQYEIFYEMIKPAKENSKEAFAWFSDIPHWLFNAIMYLSCEDTKKKVDELITKAPVGNPLSFWLHPLNQAKGLKEILHERGFGSIITCPLMSWPVSSITTKNEDIRLADLNAFFEILSRVYQLDEPTKKEFKKIMKHLESENYVIYQEGVPVGTATLLIKGASGGVFNDATLDDRREASSNMMQFLMKRSYDLGLKELIVLSSPEAEELYRNLGFKKTLDIEIYSR